MNMGLWWLSRPIFIIKMKLNSLSADYLKWNLLANYRHLSFDNMLSKANKQYLNRLLRWLVWSWAFLVCTHFPFCVSFFCHSNSGVSNRGAYMFARVLSNLLNGLGKEIKCATC